MKMKGRWLACILLISFYSCKVGTSSSANPLQDEITHPFSDAVVLLTDSLILDEATTFAQLASAKLQQLGSAGNGLDSLAFYLAYTGYLNLKAENRTKSNLLTIVDFNKPSTSPRMWVIDLEQDRVLINTWSAHGKGSGIVDAEEFSNIPGSHQTSLGFYLTAEEYIGANGRSLRLDGLDAEFNTNARRRYVVMHGADYVSQDTIDANGYLGNSEGCPAVSHEVNHQIIDWVKGGSVLFITGPSKNYYSKLINPTKAHAYLRQL